MIISENKQKIVHKQKTEKKRIACAVQLTAIIVMVLLSSLMLISCGTKTLEEYADSSDKAHQSIDEIASIDSMEYSIEKNTVKYSVKYEGTFDETLQPIVKKKIEDTIESMGNIFEDIGKSLKREADVDEINIEITYTDSKDNLLYEKKYQV